MVHQADNTIRTSSWHAAFMIIPLLVLAACLLAGCGSSSQSASSSATSKSEEMVLEASDITADAAPVSNDGRIVMTLCGSHDTIVRVGESYVEGGCLARDREAGSLTSAVEVSGNVDTSKPGDYTVTYTVANPEGMRAKCERVVHVVDNVEWDSDGIPVCMYHYVYDPANPPEDLGTNHVSVGEFEEQLAWLTSEGFYYPSWAELRAYVDGTHSLPAKSIMLTFDDGEYGFLDLGIPLLEKYQVNATSFTECSREDIQDVLKNYASPYVMFESHSYDLHHGGGSGMGHGGAIYDLNEDQLTEDFKRAAEILGTHNAFAYPYGDVSDVSRAAVDRVGLLCAVTTENDQVHVGNDYWALPRVRVFGGNSLDNYKGSVL